MKKIMAIALLCCLVHDNIFSQSVDSLVLHFPLNKYKVNTAISSALGDFINNNILDRKISSIQLNGHCDSKGTDEYNYRLSLKRVLAVEIYLRGCLYLNGTIPANSITITHKAFGEKLLLNNDSGENESIQNRRVEIIVTYRVTETDPHNLALKNNDKPLSDLLEDTTVKAGSFITLADLHYYGGTAIVLPGSLPLLKELYNAMLKNPGLKIDIQGHICCAVEMVDEEYKNDRNYKLSERRAMMVWEYLVKNGIDPKRLSYRGFGSTRPIFPLPENNEEERISNRRVEIKIIAK